MSVVEKIVLDVRSQPIKRAERGNRVEWFLARNIDLWRMTESKTMEGAPITRVFVGLEALKQYLALKELCPRNVIYVSDDNQALEQAKMEGDFLTLAVPPAIATTHTDVVTTTFPDTDSLSRLVNEFEWRFRN